MKKMIIMFLLVSGLLCFNTLSAQDQMTALDVVNKRMQAHNAHDLEEFMSTYAEDVKIYTYPDRLLNSGIDRIQALFEGRFRNSDLHVEIHDQIAKDSFVINHETVTFEGKDTEYVSIYTVKDGLITDVRFVRD